MEFNPDKLETTFIEPMTPYGPIKGRKYTLTHSDETAMMFLDVAEKFNYSAIDEDLRDELLGAWKIANFDSYNLIFYAYVGDGDFLTASIKYAAFKYHMKLAFQAIFYGDKDLLKKYPQLVYTPIYVKFDSDIPMFDQYEPYGYVKDFII